MTPFEEGCYHRLRLRLLLVRHGQTALNADGRFQGQNDTGLTELGLEQARKVAKALGNLHVTALYSSPLPRALSTAAEISHQVALNVAPLDGLKEIHLGDLEGITGSEMRERYRWVFDTWNENPSRVTFPGGESIRQLQRRAWRAVEQIEQANPEGTVVAVSHNFAISAIVSRFLGLPLTRFHRIRVDLGSISSLEVNAQRRYLVQFNDLCHMTDYSSSEG